jgi:hypothetical protein
VKFCHTLDYNPKIRAYCLDMWQYKIERNIIVPECVPSTPSGPTGSASYDGQATKGSEKELSFSLHFPVIAGLGDFIKTL